MNESERQCRDRDRSKKHVTLYLLLVLVDSVFSDSGRDANNVATNFSLEEHAALASTKVFTTSLKVFRGKTPSCDAFRSDTKPKIS